MNAANPGPAEEGPGSRLPGWTRSLGWLVFVSLLPVGLLVALVTFLLHQEQHRSREQELAGIALGALTAVDGQVEYGIRLTRMLAGSRELRSGDYARFGEEARQFMAVDPEINRVVVTDHSRSVYVYHSDRSQTPAKTLPAGPNALRQGAEVLASGRPTAFGLRESGPTIPVPTVPIRVPVEGAPALVLTTMLDTSGIQRIFSQIGMPEGVRGMVVDPEGRIAAVSGGDRAIIGRAVPDDVLAAIRAAREGGRAYHRYVEADGDAGGVHFPGYHLEVAIASADTRWAVVMDMDYAAMEAPFRRGLGVILLGGLLAAALATWAARTTARRIREAQSLRREKETAEAANRAKSEFLANISHELRTPLNAILGYAQLLNAERDTPAAADATGGRVLRRGYVDQIMSAGWHLLGLIEEVLDLTRIEMGRAPPALQAVDLAGVLRQSIDQLAGQAAERRVRVNAPAVAEGARWVLADETRLRQVLLNLLSNAIKYNVPGGEVRLKAAPGPEGVVIDVIDTGRGLTPEQLSRLFQPFTRFIMSGEVIEGSGIGLSLSKRLAESMQGTIRVTSVPGQGSTFSLLLPASAAPEAPAATPREEGAAVEPAPAEEPAAHRRLSLLYVEDNLTNFEVVRLYLERQCGYTVAHAEDGERGIALARQLRPDAVILDMNLPGMHGMEVASALAADPDTAGIPIVALSAGALSSDIERALQAGIREYLTKPVRLPRLRDVLEQVCAPGEAR